MTTIPVEQINTQRDQASTYRHCSDPNPCPTFFEGSTTVTVADRCPCGQATPAVDVDQQRVADLVAGGMSQRDACLTVWAPEALSREA